MELTKYEQWEIALRRKGITRRRIAQALDVTEAVVGQVMLGKTSSKRISQYLDEILGFEPQEYKRKNAANVSPNLQ